MTTATLRIKRRGSGNAGAPASMVNAELAFNEVDDTLYYGKGTGGAGGTATTALAIAGPGAFLNLSGTQTVSGNKTFSGPCVFSGTGANSATGVTQLSSDDSTRLATTAYVKSVVSTMGGGTVTSVGLSLPSLFTVSGSPVTGSGTLTGTLATQVANRVFAGPSTGVDAAPTFRALVAADIPNLDASILSTGTVPTARGGTGQSTYTNGQILIGKTDGTLAKSTLTAGSGISVTNADGAITIATSGVGTVTSVGLSLPSLFTVTGSPVTSTGTLTGTLATQVANRVFAGPSTGVDAAPTFRALAAADIPDLDTSKLTSGTLPATRGGTGITSLGTGVSTFLGTPTSANLAAAVTDETGTGSLVFANSPNLTGTVNAVNLVLSGDLTVNGTNTIINSTTVSVDDINIVLGDTAAPTNATSDGGGITLKGTTDKTFNWINSTSSWTSSENLELVASKVFRIGGAQVLSATAIGSGVTASSLTSVGTITTGTWSATPVAATRGGTGLNTVPQGSVLVANSLDTITALDGSGTNGFLAYNGTTDTISWATVIDGGTY